MSARKIKNRQTTRRVRGYRQNQYLQHYQREHAEQQVCENLHQLTLVRVDTATGEKYVLSRLVLKDAEMAAEYKDGLDLAVQSAEKDIHAQAEAIRLYLQSCIDGGKLIAIPCRRKETPTCRVYGNRETNKVIAIKQDDPDVIGLQRKGKGK